jgi:hypothetical protein
LNALGGAPFNENCGPLVVHGIDTGGDTVENIANTLLIALETSDRFTAGVSKSGQITEIDTGHVTFTASAWAYGVVLRDSLRFTISWPLAQFQAVNQITPVGSLNSILTFSRPVISINVGGVIVWSNGSSQPIDIIFDNPADVQSGCFLPGLLPFPCPSGAGDIPPFYLDPTHTDTSLFAAGTVIRSFPVAGTYRYHSSLFPSASGVIDVEPWLSNDP